MTAETPHVGVIGAGAWGTALAILANRAGSKATLWTRSSRFLHQAWLERSLTDFFIEHHDHETLPRTGR
jgi:glycerol-3-phosphate dehydrogenase